jgi:hypothetical protein
VTTSTEARTTIPFLPRGIGLNALPCYVCGHTASNVQPDMAAHVSSQQDGTDILDMFLELRCCAWLDYRPSEPNWIQVKVGACYLHAANLRFLYVLTARDKRITKAIIEDTLPDAAPSRTLAQRIDSAVQEAVLEMELKRDQRPEDIRLWAAMRASSKIKEFADEIETNRLTR